MAQTPPNFSGDMSTMGKPIIDRASTTRYAVKEKILTIQLASCSRSVQQHDQIRFEIRLVRLVLSRSNPVNRKTQEIFHHREINLKILLV